VANKNYLSPTDNNVLCRLWYYTLVVSNLTRFKNTTIIEPEILTSKLIPNFPDMLY
jgi:hypothetical protein